MTISIVVTRGRRQDLPEVQAFLNRTRPTQPVTEAELLDDLYAWGFLLARTAQLRGVLRWQAINLTGVVRGFWVWPRQQQRVIGAALIRAVEEAAANLFCDGAAILVEPGTPDSTLQFFASCGYTPQVLTEMNRYWREAVKDVLLPGDVILGRRIRERPVSMYDL